MPEPDETVYVAGLGAYGKTADLA